MRRVVTTLFLSLFASHALAQSTASNVTRHTADLQQPIRIEIADSASLSGTLRTPESQSSLRSAIVNFFQIQHTIDSFANEMSVDTTKDSVVLDVTVNGMKRKRPGAHVFALSEFSQPRQTSYHESFAMIDFNRVTGFFLGLGTAGKQDIGPHDELALQADGGYGFADKRWEYIFGAEARLPLRSPDGLLRDSSLHRHFINTPTIAVGGEVHNITSTDDSWRAGRTENAAFAFFAREDFRDYYKLAGYQGYIAFRPRRNYEFKIEWRSDHYQTLSQTVFYGRWGGNKVLPPNPPVAEGRLNSLVVTSQNESVHTIERYVANLFGDSVSVEQLRGISTMAQAEFGHMPGADFGFNRYLLDARHFSPVLHGLSLDTRFRFEAETGDLLPQKLQYLGGPGSLPGLYRKSLEGNRMLLLNTEVRLSLNMLSKVFHSPDLSLVIYNDFGKLGWADAGESIFKGFDFSGASSILYNVGVGLGWTQGIQIGAIWRTDVHETPRVLFRLERPF